MVLSRRIPAPYIKLIPAIAFALLGVFDILSDLLNGGIKPANLWFNLVFLIPILIRSELVWGLFGWFTFLFWGYMTLVLTVWFIQYLQARHFRDPLMTFGMGYGFALIGMTCSLLLIYWRHNVPPLGIRQLFRKAS